MASSTFHEPLENLSAETRDMHRAIVSLMEELEAIDWYRQRADACADAQLQEVLLHNMNEEIEHASMVLEWIRRHSEHFSVMLRRYLFSEAPIVVMEERAGGSDATAGPIETLRIGSTKGR